MALLGNSDNQIGILIKSDADLKGIDQTSKSLTDLDKTTSNSGLSFLKLSGAVAAGQAAFTLASNALKSMGSAAIGGSASYEQSRIAFDTMLGSADKAQSLMTEIAEFAKSTPFELPEVVSGTKQLLAFGFAQQDLLPTMRKLGDLSSGLGVPVGQLTNVFGQVKVAGRLMGQDLLQFTNAGVPMIEALATTMKKPQSEIKKLVEQGKVGFPEVETALNSLTGEGSKFGGMMTKQSKSFNGIVSNMKDGFGQILRSAVGVTAAGDIIEGGLFDKIKDAAEATLPYITKLAEKVGPAMADLSAKVGRIVDVVIELGKQVNEYLGPKFDVLFKTIADDLIPVLKDLWKNAIEPLLPVIGILFVAAVGLAVDAINLIIEAFTSVYTWIGENETLVLALAAAFGVLAGAMILTQAFAAITSGLTVLSTVTIPAAMLKLSALSGLIAAPMLMPAIVIAAAVGSLAYLYLEAKKTREMVEGAINAHEKAADISGIINQKRSFGGQSTKGLSILGGGGLTQTNFRGYSKGGYTGRGGTFEAAGIVHKGEYVVPKKDVDQSTGKPKANFGNSGGVTINQTNVINNNIDMEQANRELGWRLSNA